MKIIACSVYILLILINNSVWAQQPQPNDPLGENLFPPDLVLQQQSAIGLSEDQKNYIKTEVRKAQRQFTDLQFQLQDEMDTMASLLKQQQTDEQQVLTQLDKILAIEREIKQTHFVLIIRIKNRLTPDQQSRLQQLKNRPREK